MKYFAPFLCATALFPMVISTTAVARSTFLPDWQETNLGNEGDYNKDENYCIEALDSDGSKFYHKASGCTKPKVFNETCPTDPDYISKCYCPSIYNKTCTSPYKGDEREKDKGYASCDGKYIACCSTICSAGELGKTCSGTDIRYVAGSNGCGETCYACRPCRNDCNTSCGYNQDSHATGSYSECGQACVTCTDRCSPYGDESGCSCGTYSCSDGCGGTRTCCSSCPTPSGSSGGSSSSSSSGGSSEGESTRCPGQKEGVVVVHMYGNHWCGGAPEIQCGGQSGKYIWAQDGDEYCHAGSEQKLIKLKGQYAKGKCYDTKEECEAHPESKYSEPFEQLSVPNKDGIWEYKYCCL